MLIFETYFIKDIKFEPSHNNWLIKMPQWYIWNLKSIFYSNFGCLQYVIIYKKKFEERIWIKLISKKSMCFKCEKSNKISLPNIYVWIKPSKHGPIEPKSTEGHDRRHVQHKTVSVFYASYIDWIKMPQKLKKKK
jgi:hypothetical protein